MAWPATVPTFVAGATTGVVAKLNDLRDALKAVGDPWTSYTPTWTAASVNPAIGDGTLTGKYVAAGKLIHFRIVITMGGTTTYGTGQWFLTLPVAPVGTLGRAQFVASFYDSGTADRTGVATWVAGSTRLDLHFLQTAGSAMAGVSATVPHTWATGDQLVVSGTYEAA